MITLIMPPCIEQCDLRPWNTRRRHAAIVMTGLTSVWRQHARCRKQRMWWCRTIDCTDGHSEAWHHHHSEPGSFWLTLADVEWVVESYVALNKYIYVTVQAHRQEQGIFIVFFFFSSLTLWASVQSTDWTYSQCAALLRGFCVCIPTLLVFWIPVPWQPRSIRSLNLALDVHTLLLSCWLNNSRQTDRQLQRDGFSICQGCFLHTGLTFSLPCEVFCGQSGHCVCTTWEKLTLQLGLDIWIRFPLVCRN